MRLTEVTVCEIILPKDNKPSIFRGFAVSAGQENSVEIAVESDYQAYLRQKSLNAVLTTSAVVSGVWFAFGAAVLGVAVLARPAADVVGMDSAGREHPLTITTMSISAPGAKQ